MGIITSFKESFNTRAVKKIEKVAGLALAYDERMQELTPDELRGKTDEFKLRLGAGETLDDLLPEAFAVVREAGARVLKMKHFPVQVVGGVALHQGRIAEMKTGEGKTLVATLPAYLNALTGKGVHIVTVNDYLAKRDMEWMGKLYTYLGLSAGCVTHDIEGENRKAAYAADITYGTNNEFGFDYLRDNMAIYKNDLIQRELNFALVDEVDSILIDEARTPLIISGEGDESTKLYHDADRFVRELRRGVKKLDEKKEMFQNLEFDEEQERSGDFLVDEKDKTVSLTASGTKRIEEHFDLENLSDPANMEINHHIIQALKARNTMERDIDYVVKDGEVIIVDEFTGRLMYGRRYSDGLHQAIEAKEGIVVQKESKTLATITIQNYFRMYQKLAGMTGTAKTEEEEFSEIYNMDVLVIPTNKPMVRNDFNDVVFQTERAKFAAIVESIAEIHKTGQPILVGTISIEKSEILSDMLKKRGIAHNVLNAKQHEKEAEIVAQAGRQGQVTIATNMAGRGTDIVLGGNPEFEARKKLKRDDFDDDEIADIASFVPLDDERMREARKRYNADLAEISAKLKPEAEAVVSLGGLYIVGSERHESRRIDNQLRGRSGRQGDPGATQFFISMEDELLRLFGGEQMRGLVSRLGLAEDEEIETGMLSKSIEGAQKKVESRNFSARKYVLQYDNVMNKQREAIYADRRRVLEGKDMKAEILDMTKAFVSDIVDSKTRDAKYAEDWDMEALAAKLAEISPQFKLPVPEKENEEEDESAAEDYLVSLTPERLKEDIADGLFGIYEKKNEEIPSEHMRELERMILLQVTDNKWMEHIDAMDQMRTGINLRAHGQVDPARAYAEEGYEMFLELTRAIREETVKYCFNVEPETKAERHRQSRREREVKAEEMDYSMFETQGDDSEQGNGGGGRQVSENYPGEEPAEPVRRSERKIGRNEPCPCGSGKKYKNCCGRN
jgi:preprotein translocase subunit SecA